MDNKSKTLELVQSKDSYYDPATNWDYWSTSLYKDFERCEAAALAKLKGQWEPKSSPVALLVGNYLHSYFESMESHENFIEKNQASILAKSGKNKGNPKAEFRQADDMITTLNDDDFFNAVYQGDKEVPVIGQIGGLDWKGKLDCLNVDKGYFVDLKTVDDIHKRHWDDVNKRWVSFIEDREYVLQMAVYRELLRQEYGKDFEAFIFAVSKQDQPDKCAIRFEPFRYAEALEDVPGKVKHFEDVKNGVVAPTNCGTCEYCRMTKELSGFIEVADLID